MAFQAGAAVAQFQLDTSNYDKGKKTIQQGNKTLAKSAKIAGAAVATLGLAAAAAMGKAIGTANDFQKAFSNVNTLVDQTAVNTQGMALELLTLDGRLGSAKELTDGLYQALSASVEPAKAVEFVGEAAKFAGAALVSTNTAVDVITTGLNAYGFEADKATDISDKLFSVIKLGKTTGDELSATIGQSIPLAANMGISFDELGASIAVMTRQGINSANATTQFNAAAQAFLKPSEEMEAAIKSLGFESGSVAVEQLGLKGALDAVIGSTDGSKEAMAALLPNTRALRGAMALTGEGAKDFDNILRDIQNSTGATETAFAKQERTFATFKNTSKNLETIVGNIGKSFADDLAVGATEAANSMIDFLVSGSGAEVVGNIVAGVASTFKVLKQILTPIINTLMVEGKEIFESVGGAIESLGGGTGEAAGAFNILSYGVNIVTGTFKVMSTILQSAINNVSNLITAIRLSGGVVDNFFQFLSGKKKWGEVVGQADAAARAFAAFGKGVVDGWGDVFTTVVDEATGFQDAVKSGAEEMTTTVKTTFATTKESVVTDYLEMITGQEDLTAAVVDGAETMKEALTTATADVDESAEAAHVAEVNRIAETNRIAFETTRARNQFERDDAFQTAIARNTAAEEFQANELARQERLRSEYEQTAQMYISTFAPVLESIGESLVNEEKGWADVKKAALTSIASIVRGYAEQWAVSSIAAFATGNIASGIGYAAASTGGFIAASVIPGFADGGSFTGPAIVGEDGPELIYSEDRMTVIPSDETATILSGNERQINISPTYYVNTPMDIEAQNERLGRLVQGVSRRI